MRPTFAKSANVLATLSLLSGVVGTSTSLAAGPVATNSVSAQAKAVSTQASQIVTSQIDIIDHNIRTEFPTKLSAELREESQYIYAQQAGAAAVTIAMMKLNKFAQGKLTARAKRQLDALQLSSTYRLPQIEGEIGRAERIVEINAQKLDAIDQIVTNPDAARAGLVAKYSEEIAEIDGKLLEINKDVVATQQFIDEAAATGQKADAMVTELLQGSRKGEIDALNAQRANIAADLADVQHAPVLSTSHIARTGNIKTLRTEIESATKQIEVLKSEKHSLEKRIKTATAQFRSRTSLTKRFVGSSVRIVVVAGATVVLADAASGYYVSYVLGQSTDGSVLHTLYTRYDVSPEAKKAVEKAAADLSAIYQSSVETAKEQYQQLTK